MSGGRQGWEVTIAAYSRTSLNIRLSVFLARVEHLEIYRTMSPSGVSTKFLGFASATSAPDSGFFQVPGPALT